MRDTPSEGKGKLRRNWTQQAIDLALRGQWKEALRVNESILNLFPTDIEARNRLGKAHLELGQYQEALAAYRATLEVDPNNVIARKNIRRLESLSARPAPPVKRRVERIAPHLFLEEMGKTVITALRQPASAAILAGCAAGDQVTLQVDKGMIRVVSETGEVLGTVEPGLSRRLINLQKAGNRYTAALAAVDDDKVKVIIRETYRHPSQAGRPSFPAEGEKAPRPYAKGFVRYIQEDEDLLVSRLDEEEEGELDLETIEDEEAELFEDNDDLLADDDLEE
jgi:tetratricopeptide (TPR) repeat protein